MDDSLKTLLSWMGGAAAFACIIYLLWVAYKKIIGVENLSQGPPGKPPKVHAADLGDINKELNKISKHEAEMEKRLAEIRGRQIEFRNDVGRDLDALKAALADVRRLLAGASTSGGRAPDPQDRVPERTVIQPADPRPPRVMDDFRPPEEDASPYPPIILADSGRQTIGSLVKDYNENPQEFKRRFDVREFTVANMQAMGKGQGVTPVFRLAEPGQGEYWLISQGGINYALPRYKAIYNLGQFKSAGMDRVFACNGFVEGYRYRKLEVVKPAKFHERGGDELEMVDQGVLELEQGEKEV